MRQKAEYTKKENVFNSENPWKNTPWFRLIQMYKWRIKKKKHIFTKVWVLPRFYTSGKALHNLPSKWTRIFFY